VQDGNFARLQAVQLSELRWKRVARICPTAGVSTDAVCRSPQTISGVRSPLETAGSPGLSFSRELALVKTLASKKHKRPLLLRQRLPSITTMVKHQSNTQRRLDNNPLYTAAQWFATAQKLIRDRGLQGVPLDRLVRDANQHVRTVESLVSVALQPSFVQKRLRKFKAIVAGWEAARGAEVLPAAFTAAAKWFGMVKQLAATETDPRALGNLASVGNRHIKAVQACEIASYPRGSRLTIACLMVKWKHVVLCWDVALIQAHVQALRAGPRRRRNLRDEEKRLEISKKHFDNTSRNLKHLKVQWSVHRAKQVKKRTCSHCGAAAPLSARAFPYCGGCRRSAVPRVDRPRYCSEECQRAHWLAGHMNECPSCTG